MRLNWSHMKRSALGAAFAATCLSSLQFSGCIKNSARDLSSAKISKQATQSALEAEREVEERRRENALIASKKTDSTDMKLSRSTIEKELSASERSESPLAKFLRGKHNPEAKADPFLVAEAPAKSPVAKAKEAQPLDQLLADKAKRDAIQQTKAERKVETPSFSIWDDLINDTPETSSEIKPAEKSGEVTVARTTDIPEWAQPLEQSTSQEKPAVEKKTSIDEQWDSIFSVAQAPNPNTEPVAKSPLENAPAAEPWLNTIAEVQIDHRAKIASLLEEAHAKVQLGDLQGAYRSALMAEAVAIENGVRFTSQEETPADLAQSISDRIWGKPKQEQVLVQPKEQRLQLRNASDAPVAVERHDQVFQADPSFPQWKALPPLQANESASFERMGSAQADPSALENFTGNAVSSDDHLRNDEETQPIPAPSFPSTSQPHSQRPALRAPLEASQHKAMEWKNADLEQPEATEEIQLTSVEANAPLEVPEMEKQSSTGSHSALIAKLSPPMLSQNKKQTETTISLDQSSEWNEGVSTVDDAVESAGVDEESPGSYKWGLIGLIAAILSTVIGLKLARAEDKKSPESAQEPGNEADTDQHQLRIRRAA